MTDRIIGDRLNWSIAAAISTLRFVEHNATCCKTRREGETATV